MRQRWIEFSVGVFVLAGFLALVVLALQVSGLSAPSAASSYRLYAQFDDLGGLAVRAKVSMAGVTIGRVSDITLDLETYTALVEMEIRGDVDALSTDSTAAIKTAGLLGEKFVDIRVGADPEYLAEGDTIFDTQSALNIEKLVSDFASGKI